MQLYSPASLVPAEGWSLAWVPANPPSTPPCEGGLGTVGEHSPALLGGGELLLKAAAVLLSTERCAAAAAALL